MTTIVQLLTSRTWSRLLTTPWRKPFKTVWEKKKIIIRSLHPYNSNKITHLLLSQQEWTDRQKANSSILHKTFNPFPNKPWFLRVCSISLLKTVGKGEIAHNEQFLLFSQCFLSVWRTFCHFDQFEIVVRKTLPESRICVWERVNLYGETRFWHILGLQVMTD